jgi:hypothetical protein
MNRRIRSLSPTTRSGKLAGTGVLVILAALIATLAMVATGCAAPPAPGNTGALPPGDIAVLPPQDMQPGPDPDIDWSVYPVIIDGIGLEINPITVGDSIFPTHLPLGPVAAMLGSAATIDADTVRLDGLAGPIRFIVGSADFVVDGTTVTLEAPAIIVDGTLYVPISFFRTVFGAGAAYFAGGHVYIETLTDMA